MSLNCCFQGKPVFFEVPLRGLALILVTQSAQVDQPFQQPQPVSIGANALAPSDAG